MSKSNAPIVLFVYNRPWHTKQTVESLKSNEMAPESDLIIFSDGPKNDLDESMVHEVRSYLYSISGFNDVQIITQNENIGLANSVITGVTRVITEISNHVIVLEDDLLSAPCFLKYMNNALEVYSERQDILSISAYNHPPRLMRIPKQYEYDVFLNLRPMSQGWGTWKEAWGDVDWGVNSYPAFIKDFSAQKEFNAGGSDLTIALGRQIRGERDSWAIRWAYHHFQKKAYSLCPVRSYINNIGHDSSGTHCGESYIFRNDLSCAVSSPILPPNITPDELMNKQFSRVYDQYSPRKLILKMNDMFSKMIKSIS